MHTTGACHCGAVEYEAEIDPNLVGMCHCRDCQIISGSAFRMATGVAQGSFKIAKGEPRTYVKTAESGNVRHMMFCADCGTHLASVPPEGEGGGYVSIRVATSHDFDKLQPAAEIWCSSKVAWMPDVPDIPKFDKQP